MTEYICSAAVVAILIVGAIVGEPIDRVLWACSVPVAMGLAHRVILRYRK